MQQDILIHDRDFILEAQTFVSDGKGSYSATEGNHDDVIMGALVAYQGVIDSPKYPTYWVDTVLTPPTHDDVDALIFADHSEHNEDFLEKPLGQHVEPIKSVKTITLLPANYKKNLIH
jgi:hypothetical protein